MPGSLENNTADNANKNEKQIEKIARKDNKELLNDAVFHEAI